MEPSITQKYEDLPPHAQKALDALHELAEKPHDTHHHSNNEEMEKRTNEVLSSLRQIAKKE